MKNIPLRYSIAISFIVLVLVTSFTLVILSYRSGQRDVSDLANRLHSQTFARVHGLIENFMSVPQKLNEENILNFYTGVLDSKNPKNIGRHLFRQFQQYPNLISMEYADEQRNDLGPARNLFDTPLSYGFTGADTGLIYRLYAADRQMNLGNVLYEEPNYDPRGKSWYQHAVRSNEAAWTPIYLWPNGDVGLDAVAPIKQEGKMVGVLDTAITLNEISNFLKSILITPNSNIYIVEANGLVVAGSDITEPFVRKNGDILRLSASESASLDLKRTIEYINSENIKLDNIVNERQFMVRDGQRNFVTIAPYTDVYGLNWLVIMNTPESDIMANLYANNRNTTIIIIVATIISLIIAYLLSSWITLPLTRLTKYSQELSQGQWDQPIAVQRGDEIGQLAEAFREMSSQLKGKTESLEDYAQRLLDQRQKLEAVMGSMGDAVCVVDNHKYVILVNNALLKITGYDSKDLIGKSIGEFINLLIAYEADKDKTSDILNLLYSESSGVLYFDTTDIRRKDGSIAIVDGVGSRLKDEKGRTAGIVWVMRDITKQQELEKMKNVFVSLASHQLRTPLTGIKWSIGNIEQSKAHVPVKIMKLIKDIDKSNNKMISLVEALLSISRIEADKGDEIRKIDFSAKTLVSKAYAETKRVFKEKNIKLAGLNGINSKYQIHGDEEQLVQLFVNLLQNAATYSHTGKTVTVDAKKDGEMCLLSVADQGYGIPEDQKSRIFERFFRASNVSETIPGTGLGLYYAKRVVDLHGGRIWFESKENKGTTFYVELPLKPLPGKA